MNWKPFKLGFNHDISKFLNRAEKELKAFMAKKLVVRSTAPW